MKKDSASRATLRPFSARILTPKQAARSLTWVDTEETVSSARLLLFSSRILWVDLCSGPWQLQFQRNYV